MDGVAELFQVHEQELDATAARLHDGPIQTLTAGSIRLGLLKTAGWPDAAAMAQLAEVERLFSLGVAQVRSEMNRQRSAASVAGSCAAALQAMVDFAFVDEQWSIESHGPDPPPPIGGLIYRVVQDVIHRIPVPVGERVVRLQVNDTAASVNLPFAPTLGLAPPLDTWLRLMNGAIVRARHRATVSIPLAVERQSP